MRRDFCLYCGIALAEHPPTCGLTPELRADLERREGLDLAEFYRARQLTMRDMAERVETDKGVMPIAELLTGITYPNAIRELGVRRTETELVQLVYEKQRGTRLYRWRFV
jgi:hypothetical protein